MSLGEAIRPASSLAGPRRAIAALSISTTLNWACLYYAFAALLPEWEAAENWPKTGLTAAFAGAVLLSALAAPVVGRRIDRGQGPRVFVLAGLFGAVILSLIPFAPIFPVFAGLWLCLGLAMAGTLYEPCFALLTRALGADARRAITLVTLVGGFAGTLAFPLIHWLSGIGGWRLACWSLAAILFFVALPLHYYAARRLEAAARRRPVFEPTSSASTKGGTNPEAVRTKGAFWALSAAFALVGAGHGLIINHALPMLSDFGFSSAEAIATVSAIGPMQVLARLLLLGTERRLPASIATLLSFVALTLAATCLLFSAGFLPLLVLFAALQGFGYGAISILRPVLLRETMGEAGFGAISGTMAAVYVSAVALAPFAGSLLWRVGGYSLALGAVLLACLAAMVCLKAATGRSASAS
ncbi:Predicted arabinose efflux permease, MFS family [Fulvimarina manganoxydans]|uniref:Predicted arabinose efflux permease, MFS family n=1 Tax=Fulvimarina manganoxydans TaxID=937218 RepID=A0A1W2EEK3_9HYPH|nr:MFS transporter [Fulvimarina manganoxydans]SMD07822.1 Predicted arabinose efflux permease, MFS family [Fulvimarina manganoxydans]